MNRHAPMTLGSLLRIFSARHPDNDNIVQGFGVVPGNDTIPPGRRVVAVGRPALRVAKGADRAVAVIRHLRKQQGRLHWHWEQAQARGFKANHLQAGFASCGALADALQACLDGNLDGLKTVLERLVNDAATAGVVTP